MLRVLEASVLSLSRRRGAPEVVPFLGGSLEFIRFRAERGEGAKMLSSVPGGHIWGHGGPAQHPRVDALAGLTAKRVSPRSKSNIRIPFRRHICDP